MPFATAPMAWPKVAVERPMRDVYYIHHLELDVVARDTLQDDLQDVLFGRRMPCCQHGCKSIHEFCLFYLFVVIWGGGGGDGDGACAHGHPRASKSPIGRDAKQSIAN
jgi:hypothetical protein